MPTPPVAIACHARSAPGRDRSVAFGPADLLQVAPWDLPTNVAGGADVVVTHSGGMFRSARLALTVPRERWAERPDGVDFRLEELGSTRLLHVWAPFADDIVWPFAVPATIAGALGRLAARCDDLGVTSCREVIQVDEFGLDDLAAAAVKRWRSGSARPVA